MQQSSQIFVFSTQWANNAAKAVMNGSFQSIIGWHENQEETKKHLAVRFEHQYYYFQYFIYILYIFPFSECVCKVSKHDEKHYAGTTEQNDGAPHDGTFTQETKT